ncbi:Hypothetical predicted protein [Pelobates cultripes]|uniref:Uncharacterized protein n=1 Tax=Pelobates cultripes TaxID=61616 RepID=A0AAD1RTC3_PELCU|nr:Hypothetical predicted protein [Pelobates cultripes]
MKQAEYLPQDGAELSDTEQSSEVMRNPEAPLTQLVLQIMLDSAVTRMQSTFTEAIAEVKKDLTKLAARTQCLEMDFQNLNTETEKHLTLLEDQIVFQESKIMSLKDRSRQNNIRLRDIPTDKLLLDCVHRVPKPQHLPSSIPRDVLTRLNFFHIKEQILRAHRNKKEMLERFKGICMFMDFSAETMRRRRTYKVITETLRHNNIPYRRENPVNLIILKEEGNTTVTSPLEVEELLRKWKIPLLHKQDNEPSRNPQENGRVLKSKTTTPKEV